MCVSLIGGRVDYLLCMLIAALTSMTWFFVSFVYRVWGHLYLTDSEFIILNISVTYTASVPECALYFLVDAAVHDMLTYVEILSLMLCLLISCCKSFALWEILSNRL